ncbi:SpoIIE family protein phosphatase [Gilvimarinus sp. F26214L]|uniref:SpoIIE family protein phosphatase n=1 Tax=Gilvimarinus sp. DZF01 TaxID=3461371 RepID=UPI0040465F82
MYQDDGGSGAWIGADPPERPLTILIAEDSEADRRILEAIIRQEGHRVISARDGMEALSAFKDNAPDVVLLDALMPGLDGFATARRIRELAGERWIPVIFLTSLTDSGSLVRCLEAGGDDFLQKPYNQVILQAKIRAFNRMRGLHHTVLAQRNQIVRQNQHLLQEQMLAKQVFDNVAHSGCLNAPNIRYHLSPRAIFNGDVLLAARRPSGSMMVLLGDFTGHGLPAAIGAMPLASTFYSMVHRGFALEDVLREINGKLNSILPLGVFCCASVLEMDFRERRLTVWNGGLPECLIYRKASGRLEMITSRHLPLGVVGSSQLKVDCRHYEMDVGDRCYLWSDGIHESRNSAGEMFGEKRLRAIFRQRHAARIFPGILSAVRAFVGSEGADDDLSLVEVTMVEPERVQLPSVSDNPGRSTGLMEWELDFEVKPSTFKHFDPLPLLLGVLTEVPGLRRHSGSLYTILAELYSNALEHGVLRLDSRLKQTPEGFGDYYEQRRRRLAQSTKGYVRFHLSHESCEDGGRLTIRVSDSGRGFASTRQPDNGEPYSGRGIALVRNLCDSLRFLRDGREVEAVYRWTREPVA